jgi:asparagine synthase (glutamine-hydrolysing)
MVSDVPLGAFLSGGVDSSTVVALMQEQSTRPVRTFSIGFREEDYDEAGYARTIAAHLGTDHTEFYVTAQDAIKVVPQLASLSDEPFADSSLIPTLLVARLARRYVTVSLSGDGGDELFAGYTRYPMARRIARGLAVIPAPLRLALARAIETTKPEYLERIGQWIAPLVPRAYRFKSFADRLYKAAEVLPLGDVPRFYRRLVAQWPDPAEVFLDSPSAESLIDSNGYFARFASEIDAMRALDLQTYLPDDILVKIDRSAMSTSLETRVPLLDHGLIEFAWRVPVEMHIQGDRTKRLLRRVLYRYVPPALIERPKMGFGLPIGIWLRGPLRDWAEDLLAEPRLREDGLLNVAVVRRYWQQHVSGERNWQYRLWCVLMFQAWRASLAAT